MWNRVDKKTPEATNKSLQTSKPTEDPSLDSSTVTSVESASVESHSESSVDFTRELLQPSNNNSTIDQLAAMTTTLSISSINYQGVISVQGGSRNDKTEKQLHYTFPNMTGCGHNSSQQSPVLVSSTRHRLTSTKRTDPSKIARKVTLESLLAKDSQSTHQQKAINTNDVENTIDYKSILSKWQARNQNQNKNEESISSHRSNHRALKRKGVSAPLSTRKSDNDSSPTYKRLDQPKDTRCVSEMPTQDIATTLGAPTNDQPSITNRDHTPLTTTQQSSPHKSNPSSCQGFQNTYDLPLHPAEQSVMAMLLKPSASTPLGVELTRHGWRILISQIDKTSLLYHSDLRVGQTILAVNGIPANDFAGPQAIMDALLVSRKVVIVATKSVLYWTEEPIGLVLGKSTCNSLCISQLFTPNPILQKGMTLIALNHETDLDLHTANRILQSHQSGSSKGLNILVVPTSISDESGSSSMTLYLDETCVTAQLLPSCRIKLCKHANDWRVIIASIQNHPKLRVGQTVLAINGMATNCFGSIDEMQAIFEKSPTLIFATNSILAAVVKPTANSKVGIAFRSFHGQVRIHRIDPRGLFKGMLTEGMKVIAINGSPCPRRLETANSLVKDCVGTLSIIAVADDKAAEQ